MKQEPKIGNLLVKYFEEIEGFGGKKYVVYSDPNNSNILAEDYEYEIYKNEYQNREEPKRKEGELGFNLGMKKNKPVNLTKEQQKIEQRIQRGDDKTSKITASGSQFISDIFEANQGYGVCQMCQAKELVISDKDLLIEILGSRLDQKEQKIMDLTRRIRAFQQQLANQAKFEAQNVKAINRLTAQLGAITKTIAIFQEQKRQNQRKIDNYCSIAQSFTKELQAKQKEISQLKLRLGEQSSKQKSIILQFKENNSGYQDLSRSEIKSLKSLYSSSKKQMSMILVDAFQKPIIIDLTTNRISTIRANQKIHSEIYPFEETIKCIENLPVQSESIRPFVVQTSQMLE